MRRPVVVILAALAACIVGGAAVVAQSPPPSGMDNTRMDGHGPMDRGGPGPMRMHGAMRRFREFALIYPAADRNLSGPDVQKIAEAFLLFNGNHSWKVADVKEEGDRVTFALTTTDGGEIARFAMDRHTGRPERIS